MINYDDNLLKACTLVHNVIQAKIADQYSGDSISTLEKQFHIE